MKEKLKAFFTSEKLRGFFRRVFSKKVIIIVISLLLVLAGLRIAFSMIFEVNGVVQKVDGKNIVVSNFLTTKTVNVGDYPLDSTGIQPGEKVRILKNLSGDIISIRAGHKGMGRDGQPGDARRQGMPGKGGRQGYQGKQGIQNNAGTQNAAPQQPFNGNGGRR